MFSSFHHRSGGMLEEAISGKLMEFQVIWYAVGLQFLRAQYSSIHLLQGRPFHVHSRPLTFYYLLNAMKIKLIGSICMEVRKRAWNLACSGPFGWTCSRPIELACSIHIRGLVKGWDYLNSSSPIFIIVQFCAMKIYLYSSNKKKPCIPDICTIFRSWNCCEIYNKDSLSCIFICDWFLFSEN